MLHIQRSCHGAKNKKIFWDIDNWQLYSLNNRKVFWQKILYYLENFKLDMNNSDVALTMEEELKAKGNYFRYLNKSFLKRIFSRHIF